MRVRLRTTACGPFLSLHTFLFEAHWHLFGHCNRIRSKAISSCAERAYSQQIN
jgi:hypothetical protein